LQGLKKARQLFNPQLKTKSSLKEIKLTFVRDREQLLCNLAESLPLIIKTAYCGFTLHVLAMTAMVCCPVCSGLPAAHKQSMPGRLPVHMPDLG